MPCPVSGIWMVVPLPPLFLMKRVPLSFEAPASGAGGEVGPVGV